MRNYRETFPSVWPAVLYIGVDTWYIKISKKDYDKKEKNTGASSIDTLKKNKLLRLYDNYRKDNLPRVLLHRYLFMQE